MGGNVIRLDDHRKRHQLPAASQRASGDQQIVGLSPLGMAVACSIIGTACLLLAHQAFFPR
jgi:hypothetical protein